MRIDVLQHQAHENAKSKGFWSEVDDETKAFPAAIALIHYYLSQALEGDRKGSVEKKNAALAEAHDVLDDLEKFGPSAVLDIRFDQVDPHDKAMRLALMHSEISEAYAATVFDCNLQDLEEELADSVIRSADFAGGMNLNLQEAIEKKMEKNLSRPHKHGRLY